MNPDLSSAPSAVADLSVVPDLSVVIVTWNSAAVVEGCLRSLREATSGLDVEVVVVDNASRDATAAVVGRIAPRARLILNESNLGLAAANNQGIVASRAPLILVCNPDVVFDVDSVTTMLSLLEREPSVGWVVPRLVYEDGTVQTSTGDLPTLREALLGRQLARRRHGGFWWDRVPHEGEGPIGRGHEAAYVVRRCALDDVGLQDERYVLDWEGIDWAERFRRAGWEIWVSPKALVTHLGGASIKQVPFRWVLSQHRGMYTYFSDRLAPKWKPVLAVAFCVRGALKTVLVATRVPMYEWAHRDRHDGPATGAGSGAAARNEP